MSGNIDQETKEWSGKRSEKSALSSEEANRNNKMAIDTLTGLIQKEVERMEKWSTYKM